MPQALYYVSIPLLSDEYYFTSSSCVLQSKEQTKKQKKSLLISGKNLKLPPKAKLHQALYIYSKPEYRFKQLQRIIYKLELVN